jgi:hypothetical protein
VTVQNVSQQFWASPMSFVIFPDTGVGMTEEVRSRVFELSSPPNHKDVAPALAWLASTASLSGVADLF